MIRGSISIIIRVCLFTLVLLRVHGSHEGAVQRSALKDPYSLTTVQTTSSLKKSFGDWDYQSLKTYRTFRLELERFNFFFFTFLMVKISCFTIVHNRSESQLKLKR